MQEAVSGRGRLCLPILAWFVAGCGGGELSSRVVDTPAGTSIAYGAPHAQSYRFEAEPELDVLRLHVFRAARCDVIPTDLVSRRTETLRGDHVISSLDQGPVQIAKPKSGEVPCDIGFARDVEVSLVVGNAVHRLGTTDANGYVALNLSSELREGLFGVNVPNEASVQLRGPRAESAVNAGKLSLASLKDYQAGISNMLAELDLLLGRGTALSGQEIARTYELYEKLRELAWFDARFKGASARFWELFFARKQEEATQNLQRNLQALEPAKALLKDASDAALPLFMQLAVSSQTFDPRADDWASGELLGAIRSRPQICSSFDWTKITSYGFSPAQQIAVHYLRFSQGDQFFGNLSGRCSFMTRS